MKNKYPRNFSPPVGQKFGKWTIASGRIQTSLGKNDKIYCKCECGVEKQVVLTQILHGRSKQCESCARLSKVPPQKRHNQPPPIGTKINKWTVISEIILIPRFYSPGTKGGVTKAAPAGKDEIKYTKSSVKCKCECGLEKVIQTRDLVLEKSKSCKTCALSSDMYISSAKGVWGGKIYNKEMPFDVFLKLSQQPCFYCGCDPTNLINHGRSKHVREAKTERGKRKDISVMGDFIYNGLDRIDSSKKHTEDNIVPCCRQCNIAKNRWSQGQFLELCNRVAKLHPIEL